MITYPIIIMIDQQNFTGKIPAVSGRGQKLFLDGFFHSVPLRLEEELSYDPMETSLGSGSYGSYGSVPGGQPWSDYGHYQAPKTDRTRGT